VIPGGEPNRTVDLTRAAFATVEHWGAHTEERQHMGTPDRHLRASLPIPDVRPAGLTTYDAKDPATAFPPIQPLRPPAGAPNVLVVLLDDAFDHTRNGWERMSALDAAACGES
jgi:hypothetical protein